MVPVAVGSGCWVLGFGGLRGWITAAGIAAALIIAPGDLGAQASPYLPLDDIAYEYIDALIARGELGALSALERPYTVGAVRTALGEDVSRARRRVVESWVGALRARLSTLGIVEENGGGAGGTERERAMYVRAALTPFATAETSARRELMRADDVSAVHPGLAMELGFRGGPVVAVTRVLSDRRYKEDPEYPGKQDRALAGRVEDAYVEGQWRYGTLALGRLARNWGPYQLDGFQLGNYAYTYDHLYGKLGTERLHLSALFARLDDMQVAPDSLMQRYVAMHRLAGRWRGLEVALSESFLFGGVGQGLDLSFLNPFNVHQLTWYNERKEGNVGYALDLVWRPRDLGVLGIQLFLDDYQVDRCDPLCNEPPSYGVTVSAEGLPLPRGGVQRWFASYTRLTHLAYRAPQPAERYVVLGVGLGRGFTDYDELRAGLDLALLPGATVRPYAAYRRQGEGDYRVPFPPPEEYADTPEFLGGVVQRTVRVGVSGAVVLLGVLQLRADVGYNSDQNAGHVVGASRSGFEGRVRVALDPALLVKGEL